MIAQIQNDTAGWVASSLFGTLLGWLCLKYLPAKDAQIKELIDRQDAQNRQMLIDFKECLNAISIHVHERDRERRDDFNAALQSIRETLRNSNA